MMGSMDSAPKSEGYLLGVDGSGRTTHAVLATLDGEVVGRGLGPACDPQKVGFEHMQEALSTAIEGAVFQLGIKGARPGERARVPIRAACFGLAGVDSQEDQERVSSWVRQSGLAGRFKVVNDSDVILEAGTPDGWGVALISSTGSICLGRDRKGRNVRVGGWGHIFSDEGGGYDIATQALRLAGRTADGRSDAHELLRAILGHWRLRNAEALFSHVYRPEVTAHDIADLASTVLELASRRDPHAVEIVERAAEDLALLVKTAVGKLGLESPPVAFGGSLFRVSLRRVVLEKLDVEVGPTNTVLDAAVGAVTVAKRLVDTG